MAIASDVSRRQGISSPSVGVPPHCRYFSSDEQCLQNSFGSGKSLILGRHFPNLLVICVALDAYGKGDHRDNPYFDFRNEQPYGFWGERALC
jgi:hypothetical protein